MRTRCSTIEQVDNQSDTQILVSKYFRKLTHRITHFLYANWWLKQPFDIKTKACNHLICRLLMYFHIEVCGEGGIRTLGTVSRTSVQQTDPFGLSGTSPFLPCGRNPIKPLFFGTANIANQPTRQKKVSDSRSKILQLSANQSFQCCITLSQAIV